ncbi:MAG: ABC transporter permease, partial [Coriobacteriaceae bacterium]|nr:ABC transporter permease [Coriobacteriaceae bacterium]
MTTGGVVEIGTVELLSASILMLAAGIIAYRLELRLTKSIIVSSIRCFIQLLAIGFLLQYLFEWQTWWIVLLVVLSMMAAATQIATSRIQNKVPGLILVVFFSLLASSVAVSAIVVEGIIHAEPWYNAQQLIPITGMILGNTMSAIAVATDRLFVDMDARSDEMFALVALGATPREAALRSLKSAIGAGMTPVLASMSAAGVVTIPG